MLVTDIASALTLLRGQLAFLRESGFDVHLVCNVREGGGEVARREGVRVWNVPFARDISVWNDLRCLVLVGRALREIAPDLVSAGTPKASLLGLLAARFLRIPLRVYVLRGLRCETETGARRVLLGGMEALTASNATQIICVSESLRSRYGELGLGSGVPCAVLGSGSSNGVDCARFGVREERPMKREDLGFDRSATVIGFVGRLCSDKGVVALLEAFEALAQTNGDVALLLVGPVEERSLADVIRKAEERHAGRLRSTGAVPDTAPYYAVMDVLALPTYREGFPNAPLEAAAAGVPTVAFRATGTIDAVVDGETGILVKGGDVGALSRALARYADSEDLRRSHGAAARRRAELCFNQKTIWKMLAEYYRDLLRGESEARWVEG